MQLETAISLLKPAIGNRVPQVWLDLGAGSGLFTQAIGSLLSAGKIIAFDKDLRAMNSIPDTVGNVQIEKRATDFTSFNFQGLNADGILMANALHFVKDKVPFLKKLKSGLGERGVLVVVEYEMTKGSTWVPWPVGFEELRTLIIESGFGGLKKIGTAESRYQKDGMYSAVAVL
jgi:trans-aconitate methyltransferase